MIKKQEVMSDMNSHDRNYRHAGRVRPLPVDNFTFHACDKNGSGTKGLVNKVLFARELYRRIIRVSKKFITNSELRRFLVLVLVNERWTGSIGICGSF